MENWDLVHSPTYVKTFSLELLSNYGITMRRFPIQSHITPVAAAGWESFRGTSVIFIACLGASAILAKAYRRLF